jgi:hypothetical protein
MSDDGIDTLGGSYTVAVPNYCIIVCVRIRSMTCSCSKYLYLYVRTIMAVYLAYYDGETHNETA